MLDSGIHCLQKVKNQTLMKSQDQGRRKRAPMKAQRWPLSSASIQDTSLHWAALQISNMMETERRQSQGKLLPSGRKFYWSSCKFLVSPAYSISVWVKEQCIMNCHRIHPCQSWTFLSKKFIQTLEIFTQELWLYLDILKFSLHRQYTWTAGGVIVTL